MKKIIFFVLLLSLVSEGSKAQQSGDIRLIPRQTPMVGSDSVIGTHNRTTKNFRESDFPISGDVTGTLGSSIVGKILGRTISSTAPTTGQVYQWNGTNWAPATISGGGGSLPSQTGQAGKVLTTDGTNTSWTASSGGSSFKTYADKTFASSINVDFDAATYTNIPGVAGNFTITASNNSNGKYHFILIRKTTSSNVVVNIDPITISAPVLKSPSVVAKVDQGAHTITLTGATGTIYSMSISYLKEIPEIIIDNEAEQNANPRVVTDQTYFTAGPTITNAHNTTENTLFTCTVPGGSLTGNSRLIIELHLKQGFSGNTSGVQVKVRANGVIVEDFGQNANQGSKYHEQRVIMNGSVLTQTMYIGYLDNVNQTATETTTTVDFSNNVTLTFTLQQILGADTYGLGMISVRAEGLGL